MKCLLKKNLLKVIDPLFVTELGLEYWIKIKHLGVCSRTQIGGFFFLLASETPSLARFVVEDRKTFTEKTTSGMGVLLIIFLTIGPCYQDGEWEGDELRRGREVQREKGPWRYGRCGIQVNPFFASSSTFKLINPCLSSDDPGSLVSRSCQLTSKVANGSQLLSESAEFLTIKLKA